MNQAVPKARQARQTSRAVARRGLVSPMRWLLCIAFLVCGLTPARTRAQDSAAAGVRIGLTYDRTGKPGVAITPVTGSNADSVRAILVRDFDFSDRISVIALERGDAPSGALNYPVFAKLGAVAVVQAVVTPAGALHVAVHEVAQKQVILVLNMALPAPAYSPEWRAVVHAASDSIEWAVLGQRGTAGTRIAYVRGNQIWTVDADGGSARPVPGTAGALSPAWHPTGMKLAFNVLPDDGRSRIVVRDLMGGGVSRTIRVSDLNMSPTFSPDGSQVVFAAGSDGTDLYTASTAGTEPPTRLTSRRGSTNTSPTFSPDGRRIAFTSGLIGHAEVYIMDADGSSADILTSTGFGDQLYRSNPDWSPDGKRVAFQSKINGVFQVMTISIRDKSTQQLTSDGENEDPSWAPDGRHIVFVSTRTGSRELWVLDTESSRARQLTHGGRVQNPAWSPLLSMSNQP